MVWYFIGVYIINRTLHGRLEIRREISYLRAAMYLYIQAAVNNKLKLTKEDCSPAPWIQS